MGGDEPVSVVWIIDPDQWPRAMLRAELIELGLDAVGYVKPADALAHLGARFPDAIVVDLRDATREAITQLFQIGVPVIGVAGLPEPEWLNAYKWGAVLRRPISIGEIADRIVSFL
jgi:DNA-binding NtrC family response regulator